jgi:hypothetical protein
MNTSNWVPLMERTASKRLWRSRALGVPSLLHKRQATQMAAAVVPRKRAPPSSAPSALLNPSLLDERKLNRTTRPRAPPTRLPPDCLLVDLDIAQA